MAEPLLLPGQALLVGLGAIPGAWLRLRIVNHVEPIVPRKHWGTFTVNLIAAFALGLVLGLQTSGRCQPAAAGASPLMLLIAVGFFGSLSTFSTFAVELLTTLQRRHWGEALLLSLGSILGGLLVAGLGYGLGLAEGLV
ncbi:CrcB family protein [Synechococcus sp. HK01-R]|uniref:FluC/FEX family fluoride channel n=1 Tax=Synechococcus sp. HK01-R TaxID=2751171 RepID=UPI0016263771|nr:CrcB family protein [Synechococcus sp. HK01-R]QNG27794.1 CrcB family protein [Synechococcus sp. HK01-R]